MTYTSELIRAQFERASKDLKYAALSGEYRQLETRFSRRLQELAEDDRNLIWEFVCLSEEMNWRMLELILENKI